MIWVTGIGGLLKGLRDWIHHRWYNSYVMIDCTRQKWFEDFSITNSFDILARDGQIFNKIYGILPNPVGGNISGMNLLKYILCHWRLWQNKYWPYTTVNNIIQRLWFGYFFAAQLPLQESADNPMDIKTTCFVIFYQSLSTLLPAWISNHMPSKTWYEIIKLF